MKRLMAIIVLLVLCISLFSACGNTATTPTVTSAAADNSASAAPTAQKAEEKPVELNFMCIGTITADKPDFETVTLPKLVKEKFPNITVNAQKLPDEQFVTSFKAKMAAGEGPDFYYYTPLNISNIFLYNSGYIKDITDFAPLKNFNKSIIDSYSKDGKVYAVPSIVQLLGTYYNKALFQKAGITEVPADWPSFLDACEKLKKAGITPIVMGDKDNWVIQFGLYQLAASIVYPLDKDYDNKLMNGQAKFADKPWTEVISKYKTLYDKGYVVKGSLGIGSAQAVQLFVDGKAAMIFDGSWDYSGVTKKGAVDFERGFFPLPGNEKGNTIAISANAGTGTYVNPKSGNMDAVMKVLEYWYDGSSPLFNAWADAYKGQVPAYNGLKLEAPELQDFYKQFQSGTSFGFSNANWLSGIAPDVMCQKFQGLIAGKGSVEELLKACDDKVEQVQKQRN